MAKWFRSAEMDYVSLILNEDAAHSCINELGLLGIVQFTDLNHEQVAFQRRYVSYIKRCDELERKLRYIKGELTKFGLDTEVPEGFQRFLGTSSGPSKDQRSGAYVLEQLETRLDQYEKRLLELNQFNEKMTREHNEKIEFDQVLSKVQGFFHSEGATRLLDEQQRDRSSSDSTGSLNPDNSKPLLVESGGGAPVDKDMRFSFLAGIVNEEERVRFERMLFRATKGNVYTRFAETDVMITDAVTGELRKKAVFLIFYKSATIERKITKICDAFAARRYPVPDLDDTARVKDTFDENQTELMETRMILQKNKDALFRLCKELSSSYEDWLWTVVREKSIYHTLNLFKSDVSGMLRGEGWIVASALRQARSTINECHSRFESTMPCLVEKVPLPWPTPPTYFETNKFTWAFQEFVDTYGVPRYREANPALFTACTFPFLFGIMYGDLGHGSVLAMVGLYLVLTEANADKRGGGGLKALYPARYMLLLMGLFAMYAGFIYNDFFSMPLNLFGTRYAFPKHPEPGQKVAMVGKYGDYASVYPFGLDPAWHLSENALLFLNSMKMKLSVVLGIIHMTWGILLRGANALYFRAHLDFVFEFLPMIIFDLALFGYMVILIFVKWSINWDERMLSATCETLKNGVWVACQVGDKDSWVHNQYRTSPNPLSCVCGKSTTWEMCPLKYGPQATSTGGGCQPPNLVNTLISIALTPGSVTEPMFDGQAKLQVFLLLLAFAVVPILLCAKPCIISRQQKARKKDDHHVLAHEEDEEHGDDGHGAAGGHGGHDEHGFGEMMIHQTIETIEFVLGMVSNTASYLRLWALSLAHSQLSEVFHKKALLAGINTGNPFFVFIGFAIFSGVTFAVIICMDSLECFLHALRLHWVEFQNKFYRADGYKFTPLNIRNLCLKAVGVGA